MKLTSLSQVEEYFYTFRDQHNKYSQGGEHFLFARTEYLAEKLNNPQNQIPVIHIAGTSGKGSTTNILTRLLSAHGYNVGSSVSPHLVDLRERFAINNTLLPERKICTYVEQIVPVLEQMRSSAVGSPTYFEVTIMLAYYIFYKEGVDYAVMETGMGGRLDATNIATAPSKFDIITRIGLDHTEFLGNTLELIATEKAGIIHPHNTVVALHQEPEVNTVIVRKADTTQSKYYAVDPASINQHIQQTKSGYTFDFQYKDMHIPKLTLPLYGEFQVENTGLALASLYELSKRDHFQLDHLTIYRTIASLSSPGRFEVVEYKKKNIIIDGAHNPQKMEAFITSLVLLYPDKKFDFLIGFKQGKDYYTMLTSILAHAHAITVTEFDYQNQSRMIHPEPAAQIATYIQSKDNSIHVAVKPNPYKALDYAISNAHHTLVVTGSLYLISELYPVIRGRL